MAKTKLTAKQIAAMVDEFGEADAQAKASGLVKTRIGNQLKEITEAGTTLMGDRYKAVVDERANREADPATVLVKLFGNDVKKLFASGCLKVSLTELAKKFGAEQIDSVCTVLEPTKTITPKPL